MHEQRLASKNMAQSSINFESAMPSSMHVNMTSYMPRNVSGSMNNRGGFVQRRGGHINRGGRGRVRMSGRRIYCQLCGKSRHFVDKCCHQVDRNFQRTPSQNLGKSHVVS